MPHQMRSRGKAGVTRDGGDARLEAMAQVETVTMTVQAPPVASILEANGLVEPSKSEPEIWRRFQEAGVLDEDSLERKDRAAVQDRIATLEAELYDYQYNMGLLLLERKTWNTKFEELKAVIANGEETLRRELAAHLLALEDVEKRENTLKKALEIEKQCVSDLEKSLREMQAEVEEVKKAAEKQLADARDITAGIDEKALLAEGRVHSAEALRAEASRKQAEADRKLQEVEAREGALRRERQAFNQEMDARKAELDAEEKTLKDWEKKLQESQERLLEGERLLTRREIIVNEKEEAYKQIEQDLAASKKLLEKERLLLKQTETDVNAQLTAITLREESAIEREIVVNQTQQELILSQERLSLRERILEQHEVHLKETEDIISKERAKLESLETSLKFREEELNEQQKELDSLRRVVEDEIKDIDGMKTKSREIESELEKRRRSLKLERDELLKDRESLMAREADLEQKVQTIHNREILVNEKVDNLARREKDVEEKLLKIADQELEIKEVEIQISRERHRIEFDKEEAKKGKEEIFHMMKDLEIEKQHVEEEREKLRAIEQDRLELLKIQTQLKEEIDSYISSKQELHRNLESVRKDKEDFEKKWDLLDQKNEELRNAVEEFERESKRKADWFQVEEERLKQEKKEMQKEFQQSAEALRLEREAFVSITEKERSKLYVDIQKEREELLRDVDLRATELERRFENEKEMSRRYADEREFGYTKEALKEKEQIDAEKQALQKELKEMEVEREKLCAERLEMAKQREEAEEKWLEIREDIVQLDIQREKLKEQREGLRSERESIQLEATRLHRLRDELRDGESSLRVSDQRTLPNRRNEGEVRSSNVAAGGQLATVAAADVVERTPEKLAGASPGTRFAWLQRCFSSPFQGNGSKVSQEIFAGGSPGGVDSPVNPGVEQSASQPVLDQSSRLTEGKRRPQRTDSQLAQVVGAVGSGGKPKSRIRRTRSIKAVVEDAKLIMEPRKRLDDATGPAEDESEESLEHRTLGQQGAKQRDNGGFVEASSVLGDSPGDSQQYSDADYKGIKSGRKRTRQQTGDVEDDDTESQLATGGKRKKRQRESAVNGESGQRRYNLRHSTIVNTKATPKSSGQTDIQTDKARVRDGPDISAPRGRLEYPSMQASQAHSGEKLAAAEAVVAEKQDELAEHDDQTAPTRVDPVTEPVNVRASADFGVKERVIVEVVNKKTIMSVEYMKPPMDELLDLGREEETARTDKAEGVAENGVDDARTATGASRKLATVGGNNGHGVNAEPFVLEEDLYEEANGEALREEHADVGEEQDEDDENMDDDEEDDGNDEERFVDESSEDDSEDGPPKPLGKKIWDFLTT